MKASRDSMDWGYPNDPKVTQFPIRAAPARLPVPSSIEPRQWLYGTRLVRGFVTVLVAPGGTGKSQFTIGVAMCLASGRAFMGDHVWKQTNAWIFNLEDPIEEIDRRIAAMMIHHQIPADDIAGRLFTNSGRDRRLTIAAQDDFGVVHYPDKDAITEAAKAQKIGYIVVDPFVKSHGLDENSNPHMDAAATAWAEIASATGAAIDLVHHTRKSNGGILDVESARGGKALTDAARVAQTMAAMTGEEAAKLGIKDSERWRYVRLDDQKANMAARATDARWFELIPTALGNATEDYPNGDHVAALAPWQPPEAFDGMTWEIIEKILEQIERGPEPGEYYTHARSSRDVTRWAGMAFAGFVEKTPGQITAILALWLRDGMLETGIYKSPQQRKDRACVRVNYTKFQEIRQQKQAGQKDD